MEENYSAMSFLQNIQAKKSNLKPTITTVTYTDGTQKQLSVIDNSMEEITLESNSHGFVIDTKPDTIPACILDDFLYLGSQDAVSLDNINKFRFTHILSIGIPLPELDFSSEHGCGSQISTVFVECLDLPETDLRPIIDRTNGIINAAEATNGRILVHCNAGVSRSASICIAYLIIMHRMSFENAIALVKSKRESIQPNQGFLQQLKRISYIAQGMCDKRKQ